ncbi:MAG: hypothetical protein H7A51_00090 [Akkermansiaceae bacterium]|nr:hypothetical protein [Akkermansiaceae bacterium]
MPRLKRQLRQHWERKKYVYFRVIIIVVALVAVIWGATVMVEQEGEHKDVVKALSGTPEEKYQQALDVAHGGDLEQARVMMLRLARLSDSADEPLGYGKAHLWVAKDILPQFKPDFLWAFPGIGGGDNVRLGKDDKVNMAQRHLEHAVALLPDSEEAVVLLAGAMLAQGRRNQSLDVLMHAIGHPVSPHPGLHAPLAHVLTKQGDDLALKERAWHLFSSLGQDAGLGRRSDLAERVQYVLSALILKKYENADIAIRRLEARFPLRKMADGGLRMADGGESGVSEAGQVMALRMAYHYHRAVSLFAEVRSDPSMGYQKVVDELEQVLLIQPELGPAIDAMSFIAIQEPGQQQRVQRILQQLSSKQAVLSHQAKSKIALALARLAPESAGSGRVHLEAAIAEDPDNAEAMLQLIELLVRENEPDYQYIGKLAEKVLRGCQPSQRAQANLMLGLSQARLKRWTDAIVSLEKALPGQVDKNRVHRLLAEAYGALGKTGIAAEHMKLSQGAGSAR